MAPFLSISTFQFKQFNFNWLNIYPDIILFTTCTDDHKTNLHNALAWCFLTDGSKVFDSFKTEELMVSQKKTKKE